MKINVSSRKKKHVNYIRDYIFSIHRELSQEVLEIGELSGRQLNEKVKNLQEKTNKIKKYKKYLNLLLF